MTSELFRDFEPHYQLVIVGNNNYSTKFIFWRGGNRFCAEAQPSYEVECK